MTRGEALEANVQPDTLECPVCRCVYPPFDLNNWHLINCKSFVCGCICHKCWRRMDVRERLTAYARLRHHAEQHWAAIAMALWAGK